MADAEAKLDRRRHAYRDDLADAALCQEVAAERYVDGAPYHVTTAIAPVHPIPSGDADLDTEALFGEPVQVFDVADGWAWAQLAGDGYVGYLPVSSLAPGAPPSPTHRVVSGETFAYAEPNARSKPLSSLMFGSAIHVVGEANTFVEIDDGGFVGRRHVARLSEKQPDYVSTALTFIGRPYLWGGKSVRGIDCSGLVQLSLERAGITCPRDTDMQAGELPGDLEVGVSNDVLDLLQCGDIVYWPRHVGIMVDDTLMVHANGTHMCTLIEPVRDVAQRSKPISAVKRLMR